MDQLVAQDDLEDDYFALKNTSLENRFFKTTNPQPSAAEQDVQEDAVLNYIKKFDSLIELELDHERSLVTERLRTWPLARLQREGMVLLGLCMAKRGKHFGRQILGFTAESNIGIENRPRGGGGRAGTARGQTQGFALLPMHIFTPGDLVIISRHDPLTERSIEGIVLERSPTELLVVVDYAPTDRNQGAWRVDVGTNWGTYQRMRIALLRLLKPPLDSQPNSNDDSNSQDQTNRHASNKTPTLIRDIRDAIVNTWTDPTYLTNAHTADLPSPLMLGSQQVRDWVLASRADMASTAQRLGLNESQTEAVIMAIENRLSLVQGPPGTGKTTTAVKFISLLKHELHVRTPILVCAHTNVAADNLLEELLMAGIHVVRVGKPVRVRQTLRDATFDNRVAAHPNQQRVEQLREKKATMDNKLRGMTGKKMGLAHRDLKSITHQIEELQREARVQTLNDADVVCATCVGSAGDILKDATFPIVLIDEASQCTEPETLVPLVKGAAHVVLVGDHFQLPPVVMNVAAAKQGLDYSMFERLMGTGIPSTLLRTQYRMHPAISSFPCAQFYSSRIIDGVQAADRPPLVFRFPNPSVPIVFYDLRHSAEERIEDTVTLRNPAEAHHVVSVICNMLTSDKTLSPCNIGVITPYLGQLRLLCQLFQGVPGVQTPMDGNPGDNSASIANTADESDPHLLDAFNAATSQNPRLLEIKTVDGFQGREKEVIVFSAVRSNAYGRLGFLADWRRINVAITRARRGLVIVGNARTLEAIEVEDGSSEHWRALLSCLREQGCVIELG